MVPYVIILPLSLSLSIDSSLPPSCMCSLHVTLTHAKSYSFSFLSPPPYMFECDVRGSLMPLNPVEHCKCPYLELHVPY